MVFVNILGLNDLIERRGSTSPWSSCRHTPRCSPDSATKHRGFVVSSDIATRGSKLIVTFGAPVAHEYAAANAARFALDLTAALRDAGLDIKHRIGVNGGHVFAGEVGPTFRRQYTVMGDAVNLAARLMAAAKPGEVYASSELLDHGGPSLCGRELEPMKVKGKAEPVHACVLEEERRAHRLVHSWQTSAAASSTFFGRRTELQQIVQTARKAWQGTGWAVVLEGEAGVGKTRLLEEALGRLPPTVRAVRGACFEHLEAAAFSPWVDVLESLLDLDRGEAAEARTGRVQDSVRGTQLEEFASLLNPLLNLALPHSKVVAALDARGRRQKLFDLVTGILTTAAGSQGLAVVIEDAHWMDESSMALVDSLARRRPRAPLLLVVTTRSREGPLDLGDAGVVHIGLAELSRTESLAMVREALGVADLPREVGDAVYAKTRGNPLFLEEVVHSLQQPGLLERITAASSVARAAELASLAIPDRVQGLLMSRIDSLPSDTREVLKAGSVVGRSFGIGQLSAIDEPLLRPVSLERAFAELAAAGLVVPAAEGDGSMAFRHALVQDVAYESLPFSRRRHLHHEVARHLESVQAGPDHALLVHHYSRAGDGPRTRFHAVRASESAVAVAANLEAIDYLRIAAGTVGGRTTADACMRSRLEELMGDCLETLARHNEAIEHFLRARRRWASPAVRLCADEALRELSPVGDVQARDSLLCWKIAASAERGPSSYGRALRWLEVGLASLPSGRTALAGRLDLTRSFCFYRLGRLQESLRLGEDGYTLALGAGDLDLQAYACTIRSLTLYQLGSLEEAITAGQKGVILYEEVGDLLGQARSHNNLAASYQLIGELRQAIDHMELSLSMYARVAHVDGVAMQHANLAAVLLDMGEVEEAARHLEETISFRGSSECPPGLIGWALVLLARARLLAGDLEAARASIVEGRDILERARTEAVLLDADVVDAELRLAEGDRAGAERACRRVISEAKASGAEPTEGEALRVLGLVQMAKGDPEAAVSDLRACVDLAAKGGADFLRAQALAVLAEAQAACAGSDAACEELLGEAIALFRKMGAGYELRRAHELRERLATQAVMARADRDVT